MTSTRCLVKFESQHCVPCKAINPTVEKLCKEFDIFLSRVDVDESPDLVQTYGIRSIPTLILFDGGIETKRITGAVSEKKLREFLS